ncbi:hypothetical protein RB653_007622 [Dictyostelium firmibasis]|uniref:EGF-like domain-containing protein n=1 Tax=Dictyostelium firmibasis TaxID=79012 RepID=A0AAN7TVN9_9MYCE
MKFLIFIILFLFYQVNPLLTNSLSNVEYLCADSIAAIFLNGVTFPYNGSYGYEYCDNINFFCTGDSVSKISFSGLINSFNSTYLNCFKQLSILELDNCRVSQKFFTTNITAPIKEIRLITPNSNISFSGVKLNPLVKSFNYIGKTPLNLDFDFSTFSDVQNLTIDYNGSEPNWNYYNDLTESKIMSRWSIVSANVPSFNLMNIEFLTIYFSKPYLDNSKNNYKTFKNISHVKFRLFNISNPFELVFPVDIFNFERNSQEIEFSNPFSKVSSLLDLSIYTNKSGITKLTILNPGLNFNYNGLFPFINLQNSFSNINQFTFINGNFSNVPDLSSFGGSISILNLSNNKISGTLPEFQRNLSNLKSVDLSKNSITGTVPKSWCELELVDFTYNNFSGNIPFCYSCFSLITRVLFVGNPNLNIQQTTCLTSPNLIFDENEGCYYLFGSDLGSGVYFKTNQHPMVSDYEWKVVIPNRKFVNCIGVDFGIAPTLFEIYYSSNGNNYTLSSESINPKITQVQIPQVFTNTGTVIFIGSYFSYNSSIISININGYSCEPQITQFEKLSCIVSISALNETKQIIAIVKIGDLSTQVTFNPTVEINNIIGCAISCNSNQFCSNDVGICKCLEGYFGSTCDGVVHYVTSVESVERKGGMIRLYGEYGPIHNDVTIKVGKLDCDNITIINNNQVLCMLGSFPPNASQFQTLNFTQNNIIWISDDIYQIRETIINCLNDCNEFSSLKSGSCNKSTGICDCKLGWIGFDCGSNATSNVNNTIDNNGTTTISYDLTKFQVSITKLIEVKYDNTIYKTFDLLNNWRLLSKNNNILSFQQILEGNKGTVQFIWEEAINDKEYEFLGTKYKLDKGSIKISINISNYQFNSELNTLQLEIESKVNNETNQKDCNSQTQSLDTFNQQQLNFISIQKDKKQLYGRFINKVSSNGRPTFMETKATKNNDNSSVTLSMSIPHCTKSCIIDPDFSVLLDVDHKSSCEIDNGNQSTSDGVPTTTIIAVIVSVVGAATLFGIGLLIYRKTKIENQLAVKLKNIKK